MSQTGAHARLFDAPPVSESGEKLAIEAAPEAVKRFFDVSAAARVAARSLRSGAEVGVSFTDAAGAWRFYQDGGSPVFEAGKPKDPDFEVRLSPGAVHAISSKPNAAIGDLGITFFEGIVARDPEKKIRVTLHSGLIKLTMRGWLGVLAHGGPKVVGWMAQKGLSGPGAVATALARLKK